MTKPVAGSKRKPHAKKSGLHAAPPAEANTTSKDDLLEAGPAIQENPQDSVHQTTVDDHSTILTSILVSDDTGVDDCGGGNGGNGIDSSCPFKKRGRKPKGGKIISETMHHTLCSATIAQDDLLYNPVSENKSSSSSSSATCLSDPATTTECVKEAVRARLTIPTPLLMFPKKERPKQNVIIHLKCSMKDLRDHNDECETQATSMDTPIQQLGSFSSCDYATLSPLVLCDSASHTSAVPSSSMLTSVPSLLAPSKVNSGDVSAQTAASLSGPSSSSMLLPNDAKAEIIKKLRALETKLHIHHHAYASKTMATSSASISATSSASSACFWCTCDFDTPTVHIPKYWFKESFYVYGCFCSPECATAYLMNELIDASTKFERYGLLNHIYLPVYKYQKNIKPAPNPHYLLEKFQGVLSIDEYRQLSQMNSLYLFLDKPMTRIVPEFHEDNDEFIITNKIIPSGMDKKLMQQKSHISKSQTVQEQFFQL